MAGMTNSLIESYLQIWNLRPDGVPVETPSSWLLPVRDGDAAAFLKVMKAASDEHNAAAFLRYLAGDGAVRLIAADHQALLMERAIGLRSLMTMAITGADVDAAEILAATVAKLHGPRASPAPDGLVRLSDWFSSLFARESEMPLLRRCANVGRALLGGARDTCPLHGDLHHDNVLDGGERGWLAIDPKGVIGERAYEVANLLGNPWPHGEIVHDPERLQRLAALYAARLQLDVHRVIAFAFAHAGLAASWDMDDGHDPGYHLRCAEVFAPLVDRGLGS